MTALSAFKASDEINVSMEPPKEIMSRLKFIGRLQKGEKINTRHMFVQPEGIATVISRTLINQDNRRNTRSFVRGTISRSFELINEFSKSERQADKAMCANLINDLRKSKTGINSLKDTYMDDVKFCCDMDTMIQIIDAKLSEIDPNPELNSPPTIDTM